MSTTIAAPAPDNKPSVHEMIELLRQADLNRKIEQTTGTYIAFGASPKNEDGKPTKLRACAMGAAWYLATRKRLADLNGGSDYQAANWSNEVILAFPCDDHGSPDEIGDNIVIHLNDTHEMSFGEIADWLEQNSSRT